jgi:hypothetical protein
MPAKLSIPTALFVKTNTETKIPYTSAVGGYISGSTSLNSNGDIVVSEAKNFFISASLGFEQNGTNVANTINLIVKKNGTPVLTAVNSYNENDQITVHNTAYIECNSGDVISAYVRFAVASSQTYLSPDNTCTFINIV